MKKSIILVVLLGFLSFVNANSSVGEIVALDGKATVLRGNKVLDLKIGFELLKNDVIQTKDESKLQLLFNDNTSVSVGNNSKMQVSDYVFDNKSNSKVQFDFQTGVFKTITGKIGKLAPSKFKLKTKTSTIGIRGTALVVFTGKTGDRISCTSGAIDVRNKLGTVRVNKGFQTVVKRNASPLKPKKYSKKDFQDMEKRFHIKNKKKEKEKKSSGPLMPTSTKKLTLKDMKKGDSQKLVSSKKGEVSKRPQVSLNDKKPDAKEVKNPKVKIAKNRSLNADLKLLDATLKTGNGTTKPLSVPKQAITHSKMLKPTSTKSTLEPVKTITPVKTTTITPIKTITPVKTTTIAPTKTITPIKTTTLTPTTTLKTTTTTTVKTTTLKTVK